MHEVREIRVLRQLRPEILNSPLKVGIAIDKVVLKLRVRQLGIGRSAKERAEVGPLHFGSKQWAVLQVGIQPEQVAHRRLGRNLRNGRLDGGFGFGIGWKLHGLAHEIAETEVLVCGDIHRGHRLQQVDQCALFGARRGGNQIGLQGGV